MLIHKALQFCSLQKGFLELELPGQRIQIFLRFLVHNASVLSKRIVCIMVLAEGGCPLPLVTGDAANRLCVPESVKVQVQLDGGHRGYSWGILEQRPLLNCTFNQLCLASLAPSTSTLLCPHLASHPHPDSYRSQLVGFWSVISVLTQDIGSSLCCLFPPCHYISHAFLFILLLCSLVFPSPGCHTPWVVAIALTQEHFGSTMTIKGRPELIFHTLIHPFIQSTNVYQAIYYIQSTLLVGHTEGNICIPNIY